MLPNNKAMLKPTATNIISVWCKEYRKDPKELKRDDWKQIVAYAVNIGQVVGVNEARKAMANIKIEKHEGEVVEPLEVAPE